MPQAPTVAIGGTSNAIKNKPQNQGGSIVMSYDNNDLNASQNLQANVPGTVTQNPFQEVNLFIGEFSRVFGLGPNAAIARIQDIIEALRSQFFQ